MIHGLIFATGLAAFGAEVALTRAVELLLGNTSATLASVLTVWMIGLALGAFAGRRIVRPWTALALSQFVAAIVLPAAPRLLTALGALGGSDAAVPSLLRHAAIGLVLLPVALCAGFAFPAMAALASRRSAGGGVGRAYAIETLGAMSGALLAGFFLYRWCGLTRSLDLLGALALVIAALAWLNSRASIAPGSGPQEVDAVPPVCRPVNRLALLAIAGAGAAILALELLWTRLLLFWVPGLSSALAAVLAGIVCGSSLGAMLGTTLCERGLGRRAALVSLLVAALGVAGGLLLMPQLGALVRALPHPPRGGGFDPGMEMVAAFLVALLLALLPTGGCATAFALLAGEVRRARGDGAAIAYAASCIGSACGALVAALAAGVAVSVRGAVVAAGFALVLAALTQWRPRRDRFGLALAAAAVAAVLCLVPRAGVLLEQSTLYRGIDRNRRATLAVAEDSHVVATVVAIDGDRSRALYTNAFLAASTEPQYGYMHMLGHLPMLLAARPERVLVIAYGTGTTTGAVALHPSLAALDVVELSPAVMRLAPYFRAVNRGVPYEHEGSFSAAVHHRDGREWVARDGPAYDVITLEPLPPNTPAAVHFYTREFYREARERLAEGGILCQWIPIHVAPLPDLQILVRTFAAELPGAWTFLFNQCLLLVGSADPLPCIDIRRVLERAAVPAVQADLRAADMESVAALVGCFVAGRERLLEGTRGASIMTDDRPEVALRLAAPNVDTLTWQRNAAAFLLEIREPPPLGVDGLDAPAAARFAEDLRRSARAKECLLRYRVSGDVGELTASLAAAPHDLETLVLLGRTAPPPAAESPLAAPDPRVWSADQLVAALAGSALPDLLAAIDAIGTRGEVPLLPLLPLLDDAREPVRLRAMVALHRRIGDIGTYDPAATASERQAAIAALRRRLTATDR